MRHPAWWLVAATLAGTAWALDPPRPTPAPEPEQAQQAPAGEPEMRAEDAPAAPAPAEDAPEAPTPEARSTGPTPQRFDPSEEVRADFPVSFPIDI